MQSRLVRACVVCAALLAVATPLYAQSPYTFVHKFHSGARFPIGRLVEGPDGSLYGTTLHGGEPGGGGPGGTIFVLRPQANGTWTFETLHHLRPGLTGSAPAGGLTLARDGSLYGIATYGGRPVAALSTGTIFRLSPSGSLSEVYVFPGDIGAEDPVGRLIEGSDGNLYGSTCRSGRTGPQSTIFRVTPDGSYATLHSFRQTDPATPNVFNPVEGFCPLTQLTEVNGALYGTAIAGGAAVPLFPQFPPAGTLFRLDLGTPPAAVTVLHTFHGLDGAGPTGALVRAAAGEFFGTTVAGGLFGHGVVFRRDAGGTITNVHTFIGIDGSAPFGSLLRSSDGTLYGTTVSGGLGYGTVFRLGASGFSTAHLFTGADGSAPLEVVQARDGNFYGATMTGGAGGGGTIFRLGSDNSFATLHAFAGEPRGPWSIVQATDGSFYGTTESGNAGGGTVYRLTREGELTILHEFARPPGTTRLETTVDPSGLIQAADGFLYGTTAFDGAHNWGTIYRMSTSGVLTVLHSFTNSGASGLMQASDGNLYCVTAGDSASAPVLFRVDTSGHVSTVYDFAAAGASSVQWPFAEGPDGALYGTGFGAGRFNGGGLFKVTPDGTFTFLYSFVSSSPIGYGPSFGLTLGSDGSLYGGTRFGVFSPPSIFRFDPATNEIAVAAPGMTIAGPLLQGRDGAIYGWTQSEAFHSPPDFFRLVNGRIEHLYDATDSDGTTVRSLFQGTDGALYGTVAEGPWSPVAAETWPVDTFAGAVFRLAVPPVTSSVATPKSPK